MNKPFVVGTRLSAEEHGFLMEIAEREERPVSDVLRRIVRQAVKTTERAPTDRRQDGALAVSSP